MSDLEFVRRLCLKDKRSWDEFVERYSRLIYSCIHSVLRLKGLSGLGQDVADDLFQEIFIILSENNFRKLQSFKAKNGCKLSSWLHQVAVNHVLTFCRKAKPVISLDSPGEEGGSLLDTIKQEGPSAKELAIDGERLEDLADCIGALGSEDKVFLGLHMGQGMTLDELTACLQVTRGTVDMRKSRIMVRLRECFSAKGYALDFKLSSV